MCKAGKYGLYSDYRGYGGRQGVCRVAQVRWVIRGGNIIHYVIRSGISSPLDVPSVKTGHQSSANQEQNPIFNEEQTPTISDEQTTTIRDEQIPTMYEVQNQPTNEHRPPTYQ